MNLIPLMRNFTIRTRMIGAIAVVMFLLAIVGGAGLLGMHRIDSLSQHFLENSVAEAARLSELHDAMHRLRRAEKDMIIGYEDSMQVARGQQQWDEAWKQTGESLVALQRAAPAQDQPALEAIGRHLEGYRSVFAAVARQLAASGYDSATVAGRVMGKGVAAYDEGERQLNALKQAIATEAARAAEAAQQARRQTLLMFGIAVLIAVAVVVPLTLLNLRSICRPLEQAQALARSIAGGDLSSRDLHVEGRDETADLLRALQEMQGSLRHIVEQVHQSTSNLGTASTEIASGNQDLSGRTEQAAASLQQTASSMAQLTDTVRQSADSARQANQLAGSAASLAGRGGEVVSQVVATMDGIHAASRKIADIIGVIDGIAFQT
ncbi:MCP four helix bundle domain-containing protein, partial [Caldimonas tepidiphila]|uniref:methyl-accepting chemotaxis protein n=1 Tax=Caldimonas tepidiphila TaxID=2315841 RepID=UPI001300A6B6